MIAAGQSIGNYRILSKIGTGGMGAVYLAEHPLIGKRVALKVIHRELAGNREVVSRFFQEARAVNQIGNEHIVQIHDFGVTPEGDHFYIMEYLEGATLASVLARDKPLEVMRSLRIGAQIASALAAAHAAGIIHRDLKPDNIMLLSRLGDHDFVKVLDFGLAKVLSAGNSVKTAAGVLLGTPQYMSPEACESKRDVDHRTDIYALGVLLFQMMTGVLPFDGDTMGEVLVKQVTTLPPAPRACNPAIPPSVEQVLLRCLAKPVDARFATMVHLREALLDPEGYLRGSPPIARARSVAMQAPGDVRTMAHPAAPPDASQQKTRLAMTHPPVMSPVGTAGSTTMIADAPVRRASTGMPAVAQPQEPVMNTMRIATPLGYSSRPPRRVWPAVLGAAVLLGVCGGVLSVTCFGHDTGARTGAEGRPPEGARGRGERASGAAAASAGGDAVAGAAGSSGAAGSGGVAGTAAGTGTAGVVAGSGGVAGATAGTAGAGASSASAAATAGGAGTAGSAARGPEGRASAAASTAAGPSSSGGASAASTGGAIARSPRSTPRTVRLTIESVPPGASVKSPGGDALGKTPLAVDWPTSDVPVTFELRLGGFRTKHKQTVITGNTRLVIELERLPAGRRSGSSAGSGRSSGGNGLMRPDD